MSDESIIMTIIDAVITCIVSVVILRVIHFSQQRGDKKTDEIKSSIEQNVERISKKIVDENTERFKQYISSDINVARALQQKTQEQAVQVAKENADIAEILRQKTSNESEAMMKRMEANADNIRNDRKTEHESMTNTFRDMSKRMADDMEARSKIQSNTILNNISSVDTKLTAKIDDLGRRSDDTNQRVLIIKRKVLAMQVEVDSIYDILNKRNLVKAPVPP